MFKLFFIKSNLRFNLSSFFFVFFIKWYFDLQDPGPSALLLVVSDWGQGMPTLSGSGNKTTRVAFPGWPTLPTQEDKVESFCVCCACERCMDFWLSRSLKCFSTCRNEAGKTLVDNKLSGPEVQGQVNSKTPKQSSSFWRSHDTVQFIKLLCKWGRYQI